MKRILFWKTDYGNFTTSEIVPEFELLKGLEEDTGSQLMYSAILKLSFIDFILYNNRTQYCDEN